MSGRFTFVCILHFFSLIKQMDEVLAFSLELSLSYSNLYMYLT